MFLGPYRVAKDGKDHSYWSLVETVRTPGGPRQHTACYLGELDYSAQPRWLKAVKVLNEQGERQPAAAGSCFLPRSHRPRAVPPWLRSW